MFKKIKPMLAELGERKILKTKNFIFEPKIDGTRCICYKKGKTVKFLNRRNVWFENRYPEIVKNIKKIGGNFILDGEICILDENRIPNFYLLEEREHVNDKIRIEILSKKYPATYFVFDILNLNGKDLTNLSLIKRKRILEKNFEDMENVKKIFYTKNGLELWKVVKKMKLEGVMAKDENSPYLNKRSRFWLKIKTLKTLDCIICGYTEGSGWREKYFGALLCGVYHKNKLIYVGKVGTGLDEEGYQKLSKILKKLETDKNPLDEFEEEPNVLKKVHFVKPKIIAEVKFMNFTKDLKMRAPSFLRLRKDKSIRECIL